MNMKKKFTKNCIEPWRVLAFNAGGNLAPCCGTAKGDFGNFYRDFLHKDQQNSDLFKNDDYRKLRNGLLTGNLAPSCINCRAVHDEDISCDELRKKVIQYLDNKGVAVDENKLDELHAFEECGGNITNKCNFSCIYCIHSQENNNQGFLGKEFSRSEFIQIINLLVKQGLEIFNFCGLGELTVYPDWESLCDEIIAKYPKLRLRIISNSGKKLSSSEIDTMMNFDLIHISCDTFDPELYSQLRVGGKLPVLIDNVKRIHAKMATIPEPHPKVVFNITATNKIIDTLEDLFRFAAEYDMLLHISALFEMEGSVASKTKCVKKIWDVPETQLPHVREVFIDLPRRAKAQNPKFAIWEYQYLYKQIMKKTDKITLNRFVPQKDELFYHTFYDNHPCNPTAFLRKLWRSFDDEIRGIWIEKGASVSLNLPFEYGEVNYRVIWVKEQYDGNLSIRTVAKRQLNIGNSVILSVENGGEYDSAVFEILSYSKLAVKTQTEKAIQPNPKEAADIQPEIIHEAVLGDSDDRLANYFADSQEPIVIWCAGLRSLQMLTKTRLNEANIKMIIDSSPSKQGQTFCGYKVHKPEDLDGYEGKILLLHASCPEKIKEQIRKSGISNEIIVS